MSYLALARKWRPRKFADVVGQAHILRALENALVSGRVHHAFLFAGTRGVGKTTIARILAKALNCEVGVSAEPCGQCSACEALDEGRFVDLIEVDAASRTGVDDTRDLLNNVQYMPSAGRFKVYLIDEVLTPDSSRFWPADKYEAGRDQESFDKQFVRNYLEEINFDKSGEGVELPADIIEKTSAKYIEAYEKLTGNTFSPAE